MGEEDNLQQLLLTMLLGAVVEDMLRGEMFRSCTVYPLFYMIITTCVNNSNPVQPLYLHDLLFMNLFLS